MFTAVKSICKPGNRINEDIFGISDLFLFVMDGASTLGKGNQADQSQIADVQTETEASRFVRHIAGYLQENLSNLSKPVEEVLLAAVSDLEQNGAESADTHYRNPCASISVFRKNGAKLECYGLGDCTAAVSFQNGLVQTLHDETLTRLDQKVIQKMTELAKTEGIHISDARRLVESYLIENRNKMNQPEGYWVLDASGKGIFHGEFRTFPAEKIHSVSLMTDGFAGICSTFHNTGDFAELHEKMFHENLEDLVKELFAVQDTDPHYDRYPRFKHRDDTTAIFAKV